MSSQVHSRKRPLKSGREWKRQFLLFQGLLIASLAAPARQALAQAPSAQAPSGARQPSLAALREGFAHPPAEARLRCYWWWLNGHTDKPTITHDLEEMKAKGFGGALLVDADGSSQGGNRQVSAGPTFGSPAWVELYTHALREADRLGLEITLNINSGWNLGGPGVAPEESSKVLTWSRTLVEGERRATVQLAAPAEKNGFYRQIAVLAYPLHNPSTAQQPAGLRGLRERSAAVEAGFSMPDTTWMLSAAGSPARGTGPGAPTAIDLKQGAGQSSSHTTHLPGPALADTSLSEVHNLTQQVAGDGTLNWNVPPGAWEILRIGYTDSDARVSTSSGAWQGRALDHMSRTAFDSYWNRVVEPLLSAAKPYRSLKYLATDSWELGGTNWTESFAAEFTSRRGYDPVPWLPVLAGRILNNPDDSARFLTDLRRTVADLIVANHFDRFAELAAKHGLGIQAESGGPHGAPIDALETFRHSAVPQTEFWSENPHRSRDVERFFVKQAASAAHIYGQRFVAAEGETSINEQWNESLAADLKPSFDRAVTEGLNRLVWHEFTSSPASTGLPGQEYFAGTHLNPKVTWWNSGGAFFDYLNRVQFLMQQGTAVNDVLYFYGDNIPNFVRLKADDPAHVLPGYDYDVTSEDALLHTIRADKGRLRGPSGVEWKLLVLPASGRLTPAALTWVERYVHEGGKLAGLPPASAPGRITPEAQSRFEAVRSQVWGTDCAAGSHHDYGKGQVFCTADARLALTQLHIPPDVDAGTAFSAQHEPVSGPAVDYIHRHVNGLDLYFVRNGSDQTVNPDLLFRSKGRPEIWDPVSGTREAARLHRMLPDGRTEVQLTLAPFGSAFLVFTESSGAAAPAPARATAKAIPFVPLTPWSVSFQQDRGAPTSPVEVTDLKSWTEWPQPGVRFFSGTAVYRTHVTAPAFGKRDHVWLQFTDVREVARLRINGQDAGTVWAKPLSLRVDPWLKFGDNMLEIEVTNFWPNRIIGDLQPGVLKRFTETNITAYKPQSPLLPSGIIGPLSWSIEPASE